jgi:CRP-like cAMP-binding protein
MREAGYRTVDMLVRHLTDEEAPPIRRAAVGEMRDLLAQSAPEDPTPFAGLERDVLPYRSRGDATECVFVEGDSIVVESDGSRELCIVLDGEAAVTRDGEPIATLGAGDPIGEIADLEWGAGFGYARTATAESAVRVSIISNADVTELVVREIPVLGERLRTIARSRLHRQ